MKPGPPAQPHQAYLLRCWDEDGAPRFMLEEVFGERQRRGFDSLVALAGYLNAAMERAEQTPGGSEQGAGCPPAPTPPSERAA